MSTPNHKIRLVMELRAAGVADLGVLSAIERVPREVFVPPSFKDRAYEDAALPIGHAQTLSRPSVVGLMSQALETGPRMKLLEIGTGSGYQTCVLARMVRRVYTIERHRELMVQAEERFKALRIYNVVTKFGDGWAGWTEQAPFERIIVTAAPSDIPGALVDQLAEGGVMVLPVGREKRTQALVRVRKLDGRTTIEELDAVRFVPMVAGLPN
jgi:protein-L-isoaspartate(D-aspartate) O-methyltransferase